MFTHDELQEGRVVSAATHAGLIAVVLASNLHVCSLTECLKGTFLTPGVIYTSCDGIAVPTTDSCVCVKGQADHPTLILEGILQSSKRPTSGPVPCS